MAIDWYLIRLDDGTEMAQRIPPEHIWPQPGVMLVPLVAAPSAEVVETIEGALMHCRPEMSQYPAALAYRAKIDAALAWLATVKEATSATTR